MKNGEISLIEEELFLEAILLRYGYDFSSYSRDFLTKRLKYCREQLKFDKLSAMIPPLLYDKKFFSLFLVEFLVSVTEMFRDPNFFLDFRERVVPILKTYPFIKIWHAGCAMGHEVYSMAILLQECDLLKKTTIYATDINSRALKEAQEGIYSLEELHKGQENYTKAGGSLSFSHYYCSKYQYGKMHDYLKSKIIFSNHNLSCDEVFSEVHVVICRNVFIYFSKQLQEKVLQLFYRSLVNKGFLCLGYAESINFLDSSKNFDLFSKKEKIFRKILIH